MKAQFSIHGQRARDLITALVPFARYLSPMIDLPGITVTVEKYKRKRTLPQNSRYWKIVTALGDHVGYTKDEMHEVVLCKWSGYDVIQFEEFEIKRPRQRSSDSTTIDFSALSDIAEMLCVEHSVTWHEEAA